jgi:hypothetical protein
MKNTCVYDAPCVASCSRETRQFPQGYVSSDRDYTIDLRRKLHEASTRLHEEAHPHSEEMLYEKNRNPIVRRDRPRIHLWLFL